MLFATNCLTYVWGNPFSRRFFFNFYSYRVSERKSIKFCITWNKTKNVNKLLRVHSTDWKSSLIFLYKVFSKGSKDTFSSLSRSRGWLHYSQDGWFGHPLTQSTDIYCHFWITVLINVAYNDKMYIYLPSIIKSAETKQTTVLDHE